jgi:predicted metal-dependent phosphoesterase TrpH
VCITDHNIIRGAIEFSQQTPIRIIIGGEIATGQGDVTGLFLQEEIPPNLSIKETVNIIKAQGGLVYLPHPFDGFRKSAVKLKDIEQVKDRIDIIEIFNSRTFNSKYNAMALEFAEKHDIPTAVGSDAHHPLELGNSYMQMEDFDGPKSLLKSLRNATYVTRKCSFTLRLYIKMLKILTGKD